MLYYNRARGGVWCPLRRTSPAEPEYCREAGSQVGDRKVKESGRERGKPAKHLALLRRKDKCNLADNERKSNILTPKKARLTSLCLFSPTKLLLLLLQYAICTLCAFFVIILFCYSDVQHLVTIKKHIAQYYISQSTALNKTFHSKYDE